MTDADVAQWRGIQDAQLTPNGAWLAYMLAPDDYSPQREAVVVVRSTSSEVERRFPAGDPKLGAGKLALSRDGRWLAFVRVPEETNSGEAEEKAVGGKGARKNASSSSGNEAEKNATSSKSAASVAKTSVVLVDVERGAATPIANVRSFQFGKSGEWLALQGYGADRASGFPLLLKRLDSSAQMPLGDVCEFSLDHAGERLAWVTCSVDGMTNALQLMHLPTGKTKVLDSRAGASYRKLSWSKDGRSLAAFRELKKEAATEIVQRDLLAFIDTGRGTMQKTEFSPEGWSGFPSRHEFDPDGALTWREEGRGLFFQVRALPQARDGSADQVPDQLRLWHWRANLTPWQNAFAAIAQPNPRTLSYVSFDDRRYVQLGTEYFIAEPHARGRHVLGYDIGGEEGVVHEAIYGRSIRDYFLVDLASGQRTPVASKVESIPSFSFDPVLSPDGKSVLYFHEGHYFIYDVASSRTRNVTQGLPPFYDDRRERNLPFGMDYFVTKVNGWSRDGRYVIVNDHWDVWALPRRIDADEPVRLTDDGRAAEIQYNYLQLEDDENPQRSFDGYLHRYQSSTSIEIDLDRPIYFRAEHYPTKQSGYVRRAPGLKSAKPLRRLIWSEQKLAALSKARDTDTVVYTAQTGVVYPDVHVSDLTFARSRRITDANPLQRELLWSAGERRLSYRNSSGETRYATLWLPANYQPGKKYPTIVNIYEQVADRFNTYRDVTLEGGVNPNIPQTTQRGYAIVLPDIVPKANNAGPAALDDTLAGVNAAVATGVVDPDRLALTGQSYGGYETAFLITQTNIFKAAVAVDMVSDTVTHSLQTYGQIDGRPSVFNNSWYLNNQLYVTQPWWENAEAYTRNSALYHAKNVETPLLIRQNDRDHATPFFQGLQFFNLLRGMRKPVVMLQYAGADHGSNRDRPEDEHDFARRRIEFFDHFLKGAPAPRWWTQGVP